MKRLGVGLMLVVFAAALASSAYAQGTDTQWRTVQLKWNNKTGTAFTGAAKDTLYLTDEADSSRTDWMSTSDWAWESVKNGTAVVNIAYVTVTCGVNNGAADSITYSIEKRVRGRSNRNQTLAGGVGSVALLQGDARASDAIYRGELLWDPDSKETLNLLGPGDEFRLVVHGDQSGTTPKMSQTRVFISYPARFASAHTVQ